MAVIILWALTVMVTKHVGGRALLRYRPLQGTNIHLTASFIMRSTSVQSRLVGILRVRRDVVVSTAGPH
jgi:hypothetical protein